MNNIYRPLRHDEIRIISLQPGAQYDPVICSLVYDHLDTVKLPFEALSYTWGDSNNPIEIVCNGTTVQVTKSLFGALNALRYTQNNRLIWIDALCINQQDVDERNAQVKIMARIYQTASQVVVWLGEEDEASASAMHLLSKLSQCAKLSSKVQTPKQLNQDLELAGIPSRTDPVWSSLTLFLDRPWFYRIWVVQEVVMACRAVVACGYSCMHWEDLHQAAEFADGIDLTNLLKRGNMRVMAMHRYRHRRAGKDLSLSRLLLNERSQQATDDRDKVFALLGLATDVRAQQEGNGVWCIPNYHMDTPQVYSELARSIITTYNSISILTAAGIARLPGSYQLPSWVPDWSARFAAKSLMNPQGEALYAACNGQPANCHFSNYGQCLNVSGILHDRVTQVGDSFEAGVNSTQVSLQWIVLARFFLETEMCIEERLFAFRRTLIANASLAGDGPSRDTELRAFSEWFIMVLKESGYPSPVSKFRPPETTEADAEFHLTRYSSLMQEVCTNRRFFVTEKWLMGIGPVTTAAGDLICIVRGACVPLILRTDSAETKDEAADPGAHPERFLLVGDAYVDGLMNGEAYDETKLRDFEIR